MAGSYFWTCAGSGGGSSPSCATVAATYTITQFTTVGTTSWTVPTGVTQVEVLVVAGGGGGGQDRSGGGGAGGLVYNSALSVSGSVTVAVGAGGAVESRRKFYFWDNNSNRWRGWSGKR